MGMGTSWADRLKAKTAALAAAEAAIAPDQEEIENREKEAELDEKIRDVQSKKIMLDMQRAVEAWRDRLSAGGKRAHVDGVQPHGRNEFFVISTDRRSQEAFAAMLNRRQLKDADKPGIFLQYALNVTKQWNDVDTSSNTLSGSMDLRRYLEEEPGVVATIGAAATRLAGALAAESKSGG